MGGFLWSGGCAVVLEETRRHVVVGSVVAEATGEGMAAVDVSIEADADDARGNPDQVVRGTTAADGSFRVSFPELYENRFLFLPPVGGVDEAADPGTVRARLVYDNALVFDDFVEIRAVRREEGSTEYELAPIRIAAP